MRYSEYRKFLITMESGILRAIPYIPRRSKYYTDAHRFLSGELEWVRCIRLYQRLTKFYKNPDLL